MSESNPYEAPLAKLSPARVQPITVKDQAIARRMLEARERGGYSLGLFYRWSARRYLVLVLIFGLGLGLLAVAEAWPLFLITVGLVVGTLLRDLGWAGATAKTWHLTEQWTEWDRVARVARGEDGAAAPPGESKGPG